MNTDEIHREILSTLSIYKLKHFEIEAEKNYYKVKCRLYFLDCQYDTCRSRVHCESLKKGRKNVSIAKNLLRSIRSAIHIAASTL